MNVRVDLNTPIKDGTEVVFRSPVDCSQVTGLKVYYLGESKEFTFADAHGKNVGDIDHLFAENVVVKVILDVTHGMAFVQNADTNAYLEGRFDDIINKLCPAFKKSGILVQCEPVEGYPLTIDAQETPATITVCGKNLYNKYSYPLSGKGYVQHANGGSIQNDNSNYRYTPLYIDCAYLQGEHIFIPNAPAVTNGSSTGAGIAFYNQDKEYISGSNKEQVIVPIGAYFMRFSINKSRLNDPDGAYPDGAQIEIGDVGTPYEAFNGAEFPNASKVEVPAFGGVNNIFALVEGGSRDPIAITVSGRANPAALIEKLTKAVLSLGGNI